MIVRRALLSVVLFLGVAASGFGRSDVYFSPDGDVRDQLIKRINRSQTSIDVAVYSFTSGAIAQAMADARQRGVKVRVVRDKSQSGDKHDENEFLAGRNIEVRIRAGKGRGIMHDKFAIFDGKEAFTGSYNWTNNAEHYNWENALFIDDKNVVDGYAREFEKLWDAPEPHAKRRPVSSSRAKSSFSPTFVKGEDQ